MATALIKKDETDSADPWVEQPANGYTEGIRLAPAQPPPKSRRLGDAFRHVLPYRKQVAVGVDLSDNALRLAKISRIAQSRPTLTDYANVPLPADIPSQGPALADFLRTTLDAFCADAPQVEVWTAIASAQVETRYLRIPKVSRRQLAKAAYWTYRRETPFDEDVSLFGFELLGELNDGGVRKYEVMAYTVPLAEIRAVEALFKNAGQPLTGVTIVPFSLQNVLRANWMGTGEQSVCTLYIGREFSRIDIFEADHLVLSRVIKAGVHSMLDALKEDLAERRQGEPVELDQYVSIEELADSEIQDDSLVRLLAQRLDLAEEDIFNMALPALERLIGQVERTLKHYALNFENKQVDCLYIFGEVGIHERIAGLITDQFGIPSQIIDLFASARLTADEAPRLPIERYQLLPAVALALSSNGQTPNFLFTSDDKARLGRIDLARRVLAAGVLVALLVIAGIAFIQKQHTHTAAARITTLEQKLAHERPQINRALVDRLARRAKEKGAVEKLAAGKFLPLAILSELSALTTGGVRLLQVDADMAGSAAGKKKSTSPGVLKLKGIICGDRLGLDVILAGYIVNLNASPLFSHAVIEKRSLKTFENRPAIYFTIHLDLEQAS